MSCYTVCYIFNIDCITYMVYVFLILGESEGAKHIYKKKVASALETLLLRVQAPIHPSGDGWFGHYAMGEREPQTLTLTLTLNPNPLILTLVLKCTPWVSVNPKP